MDTIATRPMPLLRRFLLPLLAVVTACLSALASPAAADAPAGLAGRQKLVWGADQEGGAPFIFPSDEDSKKLIGFEVELVAELERELGLQIPFQQSQWDDLPRMLNAGKVDLILNGYEWMAERAAAMATSLPYYIYALQLEVHQDGPIQSWEQLKRPKADGSPWKFGVLSGSGAEEYVKAFKEQGGAIEYANYDGGTDMLREVETGKLDATLQDTPIASYYAKDFPKLRFVGEPVAAGYYVAYARKDDVAVITAFNAAMRKMFHDGRLERIYTKYGMWSPQQRALGPIFDSGTFDGNAPPPAVPAAVAAAGSATAAEGAATATATAAGGTGAAAATAQAATGSGGSGAAPLQNAHKAKERATGSDRYLEYLVLLAKSAGNTLALSFLSFPLAILLGLLVAIGRLYGPFWLRGPLTFYVEFLRGTPLMLQLAFIFYILPEAGVRIDAFPTAVMGLAINYSAYESEIYRAGLQAIPGGQMEAALSLGMSKAQALRRIIVPQAVRIVIPPVVNDFIAMFKDTSVCSVVTIVELTKNFSILSRNNVADLVPLMAIAAFLYLAMSYPMSLVARNIEKRLG